MARKRYISTDISLSGKIEELARRCGDYAVLLFTWMVPHADDWGRMEGDADKLFYTVTPRFALLGRTPADAEEALEAMDDIGLLEWYEVGHNRYIQLNRDTFYALQTYIPREKREQDKSLFPPPPATEREIPTQYSTQCYSVAQTSTESQGIAQNTPSPSPSPTGTDDDDTRAREAGPVDNSGDEDAPVVDSAPEPVRPSVKNAADTYVNVFGKFPAPTIREELIDWLNVLGEDLVVEALRRTAAANTRSWRYAEAILRNWADCGVRTMADVERLDTEHRAEQNARSQARAAPEPPPEPRQVIEVDAVELERARAELLELEREVLGRGNGAGGKPDKPVQAAARAGA